MWGKSLGGCSSANPGSRLAGCLSLETDVGPTRVQEEQDGEAQQYSNSFGGVGVAVLE